MSACQGIFLGYNPECSSVFYCITVGINLRYLSRYYHILFLRFFQKMILILFYLPLMSADLISFNRLRNNVRFFEASKNYDLEWDVSKKLEITRGGILKISRITNNHDSRHVKKKWAKIGYRSRRHLHYKKIMKL